MGLEDSTAGGVGGTVPGGEGTPGAESRPASTALETDEARERKKQNAAAARERRRLKKLEKQAKLKKRAEKLAKEAGAQPSSEDQPATPTEPKQPEGWPTPQAQAAKMGAAIAALTQLKFGLAGTRYGEALEVREYELQGKTVKVDPVADVLAPPTAAWMATGNGPDLTPGKTALLAGLGIFGPVAFFHGVELARDWWATRKRRQELEAAKLEAEIQAQRARRVEPQKEAPPPKPEERAVPLGLTEGTGAKKSEKETRA